MDGPEVELRKDHQRNEHQGAEAEQQNGRSHLDPRHLFQERGTEVHSSQDHRPQLPAQASVERKHSVHYEVTCCYNI